MDPSLFKLFTTSRAFTYRYYFSPPTAHNNPTLLFLHGFPSFSIDWRHQLTFFHGKGYGILAPDMLGYAGSSKPIEAITYTSSLLATDIIEILDVEKLDKSIVIGHDWGSKVVSRLANLAQDRFLGFAFLAVGYIPPNTSLSYGQLSTQFSQSLGYENIGYWSFFSSPGADKLIEKHIDSFYDIIYSRNPQLWKENVARTGSLRNWLESDSRTPRAEYITEKEYQQHQMVFLEAGFAAPLNYYKIVTEDLDMDDSKTIPLDKYTINKPVFFGGALKDVISVSAIAKPALAQFCPKATIKEFDASHWMMFEVKDELNAELEAWFESIIL